MTSSIDELCDFIEASPSPYHAVSCSEAFLKAKGYLPLLEQSAIWELEPGQSYYVIRNDASIIAFKLPLQTPKASYWIGSHTDSPCFKLKTNPLSQQSGIECFNLEVYGGVLLNSWLDRDLKFAGRVIGLNSKNEIESKLIETPTWTRIPQLAIHLNREVNESLKLNPQNQMWAFAGAHFSLEKFHNELKKLSGLKEVFSWDLCVADTQPCQIHALNNEFLSAPRLDNLAMLHASLKALESQSSSETIVGISSFNHEEVGSISAEGAGSNFFENTLKRVFKALKWDLPSIIPQSMFISADMAHAMHPGFENKFDPNHYPKVNQGPVLKINANARYATDAMGSAKIKYIAQKAQIPLQVFHSRNDLSCGSTIGPITASKLGFPVIDLGNPMFSMHSCREFMGTLDHDLMIQLFQQIFGGKT